MIAEIIGHNEGQKRSSVSPSIPVGPSLTEMPLSCMRVFDFVVALVLLLVVSPILLLAMIVVKLSSRGPVFYSQIRLGLNGKPFWIHKLRSMTQNAEAETGACWSKPGDSRITGVGHFLRRTHLDELPQLWNVLRGDMSLVGPRPERPEFIPQLEQALPHYRERLRVRPGVTGLAQIQLPPDVDLNSVRRKLACDTYYVRHASLWLDLRIILATGFKVIGMSCRLPCRLLRIPGTKVAEQSYEERVEAEVAKRDSRSPACVQSA